MTPTLNLILLDASCLLNLCASGRLRDILLAQQRPVGVAEYVLEQEALYVWRASQSEAEEEKVPLDLSSLVQEGIVNVLHLAGQDEVETFVDFAALMDDGEAITIALALHRQGAVATDDRKARRIIAERAPMVALLSTLELLKRWADKSRVPEKDLHDAFLALRSGASYVPGERDPLYEWWRAMVQGSSGQ